MLDILCYLLLHTKHAGPCQWWNLCRCRPPGRRTSTNLSLRGARHLPGVTTPTDNATALPSTPRPRLLRARLIKKGFAVGTPVYIAIEGVIGVGKTTLARLLQEDYSAELMLEVFEENPFLAPFYSDPARYAFQAQIFFLLSRYRQQETMRPLVGQMPILADYLFAKDHLFASLTLTGDELAMYERLYQALSTQIMRPDLVVYLRARVDTLMARIAARDRPYERSISRQYVSDVAQAYEEFFATYTMTPLLIVDTDDLNVVAKPEELAELKARVRVAVEQRAYQPALWPQQAPAWPPDRKAGRGPLAKTNLGTLQALHATQSPATHPTPPLMPDATASLLALQDGLGNIAHTLRAASTPPPAGTPEGLRNELVDCLTALIGLATALDVDLERAYLERMNHVERC